MKTLFARPCSVYRNVRDTQGTVSHIWSFLNSTRHREAIVHLRTLDNKKERDAIKLSLPLATLSGLFLPTRKKENLRQHTGFVCIDIDQQDNLHLPSLDLVPTILRSRPEVAYISQSVGGRGYFALIPLAHPERHEAQFQHLLTEYATLGIHLDKSCRDVSRLRAVSFDPSPYFNPMATLYMGIQRDEVPEQYRPQQIAAYSDLDKVARCCEMIRANGIDITGGYDEWYPLCASLASLGESGRYYLHVCSSISPLYDREATDRKFDHFLQTGCKSTIATFLSVCKDYGVTYARGAR